MRRKSQALSEAVEGGNTDSLVVGLESSQSTDEKRVITSVEGRWKYPNAV